MQVRAFLFVVAVTAACSGASHPGLGPDAAPPAADAPDPSGCHDVSDAAPVAIASATIADDYALTVTAQSASATSWGEAGNEALVLDVSGSARGFIGHLILHQGQTQFDYTMHTGALSAGEQLLVRVSTLSAVQAVRRASICGATLTPVSTLGAMAEGITHAPVFRWPVQKAFNDVPMIVGWSQAHQSYQTVMTNEDGGTAEQCGGGASGMQAEIARWGRSTDIEGHYSYAGTPTWERCTGSVPVTTTALRMEGDHPILYWGDGHNRLFESRGGYGQTCGTGSPEKPDGDLAGWNVSNPGNDLADDDGRVIVIRPLPVDLDALGYAQFGGRREALSDHYGPWIYRITSLELQKEGKIDNAKTFDMSRYLYVDVRVADVGGGGDQYCSLTGVTGGFKVHVVTSDGTDISSPQITKDYASGGAHDWKRVAIALPAGVTAADIDHFIFDAYDNDGIYLTALGDAFVPVGDGTTNGAKLDYVRQGTRELLEYVDDDTSSCSGGVNMDGPDGATYTCVGGQVTIPKTP